ncbi:MAG: non-canonical purine NTP pyrophosphatase, partial [Bacteroidia bacterium]
MKLVFATGNAHKVKEVAAVLGADYAISTPGEHGHTFDPEETAGTLEGNAYIKALEAHRLCGIPAFADDTGLFCDGLDGLPGVHAARFGALYGPPGDNTDLLLAKLQGSANRTAHFRSVFCLVGFGEPLFFEGILRGSIAAGPSGEGGFGYDPVFVPQGFNRSLAAMPAQFKYKLSHRTRAL